MAFESVRSYIQLASGLGELTRARAMQAAQGLLALPGADEVTRRAVQASSLADQLLEAARANRASLLALVQSEVESALKHADVARVSDMESARAALVGLAKEVAELRSTLAGVLDTGAAAVTGAARTPAARSAARGVEARARGAVSTAARPLAAAGADQRPVSTSGARRRASTATKVGTAQGVTAKKATAKKATAKRASATRAATTSTTNKSTATKSATRKATSTKATAKKTTQ